jgi:hypothetical protein
MAQGRYQWLALEYDDYGNEANWGAFKLACLEYGIMPGTWVTDGERLHLSPGDAHFWIAEDEGPSDRNGILSGLSTTVSRAEGKPLAIIGNGWHTFFSKGQLAPVVDAGFHFITEMYARTDDGHPTNYSPESLADNAHRNLGFPHGRIQPAFGIFGGVGPTYYDQYKPSNPGWSDYLVEHVLVNA